MAEMFSTGYIMPHIGITLYAAFLGLFYGIVLGTAIALIVGNNRVLAHILEPIFVGIHGLPLLALGPLFVVWFGIGIKSKIFMATISVFFPGVFNIYAGFKDVDIQLIQTLKLMRASKDPGDDESYTALLHPMADRKPESRGGVPSWGNRWRIPGIYGRPWVGDPVGGRLL